MSELTGSNQRCRAQFKCVQTVVGQRFAGNGPNGLSYYYYDYYYYYYIKLPDSTSSGVYTKLPDSTSSGVYTKLTDSTSSGVYTKLPDSTSLESTLN